MPFRVVPSRDRTLYRALGRGEDRRVWAGESLWEPGDDGSTCLWVRQGLVLLTRPGGCAVDVAGAGDLTGLSALGEARRRRTGAEALTDAVVTETAGSSLLAALRRGRHTLPLLLDSRGDELALARATAAGSGRGSAAARLARTLLALVERVGEEAGWLPVGVPHRILGELCGLHRSTVTTQLNDWIYRDLLEQDGRRLRVADPDGLALEAART